MLKLSGRTEAVGLTDMIADDVWRVCLPGDEGAEAGPSRPLACLVRGGQVAPPGYGFYLRSESKPGMPAMPGPTLTLGAELDHLDAGDIIHVPADGRRVTVLW